VAAIGWLPKSRRCSCERLSRAPSSVHSGNQCSRSIRQTRNQLTRQLTNQRPYGSPFGHRFRCVEAVPVISVALPPSGLPIRTLPRASDSAACPSRLVTDTVSPSGSEHRSGARSSGAMARLSSAAWACSLFMTISNLRREASLCTRACCESPPLGKQHERGRLIGPAASIILI
jgi:hypothetical protein